MLGWYGSVVLTVPIQARVLDLCASKLPYGLSLWDALHPGAAYGHHLWEREQEYLALWAKDMGRNLAVLLPLPAEQGSDIP